MIMRMVALCAFLSVVVASAGSAVAEFPDRPLRMTVGFAAGGPTDLVARVVAQGLEKRLGKPVLVDNRPGASGNIAAEAVAGAAGDGYTLLIGTTSVFAINPAIGRKTAFDPSKDFAAVGLIGIVPSFVIVNANLPIKSVAELIDYGKKNPGKLSYSTNGSGTLSHICSALIGVMGGADILHVPYKGSVQGAQDLVAGRVSFTCDALSVYKGFVDAGTLRAIAVSTAKKSPLFPAAPGMAESGLANFDLFTWYTVMVPASTPKPILEKLGRELKEVIESPAAKEKLAESGIDAKSGMPDEVNALIKSEASRWVDAVKRSGAQVE
jgi:tripartite-type tricarboxylate transporter receptor subunit TctC